LFTAEIYAHPLAGIRDLLLTLYYTHVYKNVSMFSPPYRITSTQTRTSGEQVCTLFNLLLYYSFRQETEIVEKNFKCYEEKFSN